MVRTWPPITISSPAAQKQPGCWLALLFLVVLNGANCCLAETPDAALQRWLEPQTWVRDTEGPVLSLGKAGEFDDTHIHAPMVAYETGTYSMWYTGARGAVEDRVSRLGLATSRDGRTFERHAGNPVLAFADDRRSIMTPTLLTENDGTPVRDGGELQMWFSATDFHDPTKRHTLHATRSRDGVHWSEPSEPLLENVYAPTILRDGDRYLMWYTDVSAEPWCFRHATSADGRDWDVAKEPVLAVGQDWELNRLFYPTVRKVDGIFVMWYGSYWKQQKHKTALGVAVSRDGLHWTRSQHNPVLRPDPTRDWESHYTTCQSVVRQADGSWRMWFSTRTKPPFVHKYFAIATARWTGPK